MIDHGIRHWSEALAVAMRVELGLAQEAARMIERGEYRLLTIADFHRLAQWMLYWPDVETLWTLPSVTP